MYAQLGNIRFEGLKSFLTFQRTRAAKYAQMDRIDQRATLQRTGDELEQVSFELRLHAGFSNVQGDATTLEQYRNDGEVLTLSDGSGQVLGRYVIEKIATSTEVLGPQGQIISVVLAIELKEFIDPNPEQSARLAATQAGFATDPARVVPVRVTRLGSTAQAATVQSIQTAELNATASVAQVEQAAVAPSQKAALFASAGEKAKQAVAATNQAIQNLQNVASLAAKAPALLAAMQNVRDQTALLVTRIAEGDLTNALTQSSAVTASLGAVEDAQRPLVIALMLREP